MQRSEKEIQKLQERLTLLKKLSAYANENFNKALPEIKRVLKAYGVNNLEIADSYFYTSIHGDHETMFVRIQCTLAHLSDRQMINLENKLRGFLNMPTCSVNINGFTVYYTSYEM